MAMKEWSTDKIIAVGLMGAFVITVIAMDISAVLRGDMDIAAIAKELAIGLFSYMSRGLTTHTEPAQQSQTAETLGKVTEVASQGQQIANAIDNIKDVLKPKK
jgi:uncharacterized protein with PhoU and TrkA domain